VRSKKQRKSKPQSKKGSVRRDLKKKKRGFAASNRKSLTPDFKKKGKVGNSLRFKSPKNGEPFAKIPGKKGRPFAI